MDKVKNFASPLRHHRLAHRVTRFLRIVTVFTLLSVALATAGNAQSEDRRTNATEQQENAYLRSIEILETDGYQIISINTTWLGRTMIRARKGDIRREIVVSEATGLVLRDVIYERQYE